MKRDLNISKSILLDIEERHQTPGNYFTPKVEGIEKSVLDYHLKLLGESGHVELYVSSSKDGTDYYVVSMRNRGYEFLEANRETIF